MWQFYDKDEYPDNFKDFFKIFFLCILGWIGVIALLIIFVDIYRWIG